MLQKYVGNGRPLRSSFPVRAEKVQALDDEERKKIRPYFDKEASTSEFYFFLDCTTVRKVLGLE